MLSHSICVHVVRNRNVCECSVNIGGKTMASIGAAFVISMVKLVGCGSHQGRLLWHVARLRYCTAIFSLSCSPVDSTLRGQPCNVARPHCLPCIMLLSRQTYTLIHSANQTNCSKRALSMHLQHGYRPLIEGTASSANRVRSAAAAADGTYEAFRFLKS